MIAVLHGKVALITGSTSGIGLGIARGLAASGADIVLNGFGDTDVISKLKLDIVADFGVNVIYKNTDMSDAGQIEIMMADIQDELGAVDIVVNNAGIQHVAPIDKFPVAKWDAIMAINLTAAFHTSRLAIPGMRRKGWGRIINLASAHALVASPFKSAYVAAKHGLAGLTKTTALETAQDGITVNALCPGYVLTPLVRDQIPETAKVRGITEQEVVRDVLLGSQPTKKFVELDELAGFAVFLCSDHSGSITGAILPVDGGWTAH